MPTERDHHRRESPPRFDGPFRCLCFYAGAAFINHLHVGATKRVGRPAACWVKILLRVLGVAVVTAQGVPMLGGAGKAPAASEANTMMVARRSIYLRRAVDIGTTLGDDDLIALRPSGGIPPDKFDQVLGRRVRRSLPAGHALAWNDLE